MADNKFVEGLVVRTYVSKEYKEVFGELDVKTEIGKNKVPFKWYDYEEEVYEINTSAARGFLRRNFGDQVEQLFIEQLGGTVRKRKKILEGDSKYKKEYDVLLTGADIQKIYNKVCELDLDDKKSIMRFFAKYGLPYSDGLIHAESYVEDILYPSLSKPVQNNLLDGELEFCDNEEIYKAVYGLWLLKSLFRVQGLLTRLKKAEARNIKQKERDEIKKELYLIIMQILITYDDKVFYSSIELDEARPVTTTGLFMYCISSAIDFSDVNVKREHVEKNLYNWAKSLESFRICGGLNNEECVCLMNLLYTGLRMGNGQRPLTEIVFSDVNDISCEELFSAASKEKWFDLRNEMEWIAHSVFCDILNEAMSNTYLKKTVGVDGKSKVSCYLPSLLHALFYCLYMKTFGTWAVCEECGRLFIMKANNQVFCDESCGGAYRQRKRREGKESEGTE